jgi:hypothetical protein
MVTLDPAENRVVSDLLSFSVDGQCIPGYMHNGIVQYIANGVIPGDFLRAVICNDLKKAVHHADDTNKVLLHLYVIFFYNYSPAPCQGSYEKMMEWVKLKTGDEYDVTTHSNL